MFLHLKNILAPDEVQSARALLGAQDAPWVDGRSSAGGQAVAHKTPRVRAPWRPAAL